MQHWNNGSVAEYDSRTEASPKTMDHRAHLSFLDVRLEPRLGASLRVGPSVEGRLFVSMFPPPSSKQPRHPSALVHIPGIGLGGYINTDASELSFQSLATMSASNL